MLLGIALILPIVDLIAQIWPLRPATVVWRFGAVGLMSSAVGAPLVLLFLIFAIALAANDRKVMVFVGVVTAIFVLLLVSGMGAFALDALQMKRRVQEGAQPKFLLAAAQALMKLGLQSIASLVLAISAFRANSASKLAVASGRGEQRVQAAMLMGRPSGARLPGAPAAIEGAEIGARGPADAAISAEE